jgi:hypothetical protein
VVQGQLVKILCLEQGRVTAALGLQIPLPELAFIMLAVGADRRSLLDTLAAQVGLAGVARGLQGQPILAQTELLIQAAAAAGPLTTFRRGLVGRVLLL